ncbi:ycgG domain protein [Escherichia coli 2-052-05_S1_C3]|nr:hypothetical protein ECW26_37330 [Escherichia coli W26]EZK16457.1 ycgG domain protein [Escherichia coli 2-005-03_S1_C3]KDA64464.1 ycgG domain protein [Escherichia coli 2-052-05_S1_C1]KDT14959.1 ycgG domain protein [Escherichia coli 2-052-05_S1_C3]KDU37910.1 ycgG domain protein [Escherichia coli 3-073-06_S4_C1]
MVKRDDLPIIYCPSQDLFRRCAFIEISIKQEGSGAGD